MYFLFGVTALPWGLAADRLGAKPLLYVFYLGAGVSGLAAAVLMHSPRFLAGCLAMLGFFSGIYHPAGLGLISKEMTRISIGMGINGMFGNLGLAMAPLLTGLVNWKWGPESAYHLLEGLNFLGASLMLLVPHHESNEKTRRLASGSSNRLKAFLILLIAMMLGGIVYRGATVITPAYFELKNQSVFQWISSMANGDLSANLVATCVTSAIFIVGMLGQYAGGQAAERFDTRYCYLVFHAVTISAALLISLLADIPLVITAMIFFFFLLGMQPAENTLVAMYTPRHLHHAAFGAKFLLTFGVGALAVKMVEFIEKTFYLEASFYALAAISFVLVTTILTLIYNTREGSRSYK